MRIISDYTLEELKQLRERFAPTAKKYRAYRRLGKGAIIGGLITGIIWLYYSPSTTPTMLSVILISLLIAAICSAIAFLLIAFTLLVCPGCDNAINQIGLNWNTYCPECGSTQWKWGEPLLGRRPLPSCNACGAKPKYSFIRNLVSKGSPSYYYRIRACSHCGIMLDEKGFLSRGS